VVTLYSTLGEDAVAHGINETECEFVLTSHDLMPKFGYILGKTPKVKHVIFMEDTLKPTETTGFRDGVEIHSFCDIVGKGSKQKYGKTEV
jgi:long-chain acyl-CoA synthetase